MARETGPRTRRYLIEASQDGVNWRTVGTPYTRGRNAMKYARTMLHLVLGLRFARVWQRDDADAPRVLYAAWKVTYNGYIAYDDDAGRNLKVRREQGKVRGARYKAAARGEQP